MNTALIKKTYICVTLWLYFILQYFILHYVISYYFILFLFILTQILAWRLELTLWCKPVTAFSRYSHDCRRLSINMRYKMLSWKRSWRQSGKRRQLLIPSWAIYNYSYQVWVTLHHWGDVAPCFDWQFAGWDCSINRVEICTLRWHTFICGKYMRGRVMLMCGYVDSIRAYHFTPVPWSQFYRRRYHLLFSSMITYLSVIGWESPQFSRCVDIWWNLVCHTLPLLTIDLYYMFRCTAITGV